ncbi:MAG: cobalamin-binding protein [Dehalococcoidales bacterium]|nr:cobalamin-binding protein [Dehalococcoidales bacterium]
MRKKFCYAAVSLALLGLLSACTPTAGETVSSGGMTDQLGRTVEFDGVPQRIVSLAPSNTEILFALGLGDRVVGVTEYCDYPASAKEKAVIGGFSTVDLERVVALSPDLILATSMHEADVLPALENSGLTVFALAPATLDEVLESIILVGEVTGKVEEAAGLVNDMKRRISAVTAKTEGLSPEQRPRVFFITWHDPLMTPGLETRHDELIQMAGGINIARDLIGYADISLEAVIEANPEVMIAGVGMGDGEALPAQFISTEPRLGNTDARRNGRIYEIDTDLEGRPGPRIVDALEAFARFIHPELFAGG